jgi:hypothetical protein
MMRRSIWVPARSVGRRAREDVKVRDGRDARPSPQHLRLRARKRNAFGSKGCCRENYSVSNRAGVNAD